MKNRPVGFFWVINRSTATTPGGSGGDTPTAHESPVDRTGNRQRTGRGNPAPGALRAHPRADRRVTATWASAIPESMTAAPRSWAPVITSPSTK